MGILDAAASIANSVTKAVGFQSVVQFRHFISADGAGVKTYNPPIGQPAASLHALVDWRQKQVRTSLGTLSMSRAYVGFLDYPELSAATSGQGVSDEDLIILPDGTTGPILDMSGFINPATTHGVITEVWLG